MGKRSNLFPTALKHGAYSGTALLPGEDPDAFKKLHKGLIAEFAPEGPLEEDIVATVARLTWRKQNLSTYEGAKFAKDRYSSICTKYGPRPRLTDPSVDYFGRKDMRTDDEIRADEKAVAQEIKNELGYEIAFIEMGNAVTIQRLLEDLAVIDRLDGMIDRCLKRLLMVRGVKSMSVTGPSAASPPRKRLTAV